MNPSDIAIGASWPRGPIEVGDIDWDDLVAVDAYLEDRYIYDLLNVELKFGSGQKVAFNEDLPGFIEVALHIAQLSNVSPMWQIECTQPAFHREVRSVFRRKSST